MCFLLWLLKIPNPLKFWFFQSGQWYMDAMLEFFGKFIVNFWQKRQMRDFILTMKLPLTCSMLHKTGSTYDISQWKLVGMLAISVHTVVDFQRFRMSNAIFFLEHSPSRKVWSLISRKWNRLPLTFLKIKTRIISDSSFKNFYDVIMEI